MIATLLVTSLLVLLVMAMLSFSGLGKRQAAGWVATEQARANARLALALALGELQKQTGADTRVTARADILDKTGPAAVKNPPVLGVWKSWEGGDHEISGAKAGLPKKPELGYEAEKKARFNGWLVSGNSAGNKDPAVVPDTSKAAGKATLVGAGSVGEGTERAGLQIHLEPTAIHSGNKPGDLAWWIAGENQKARLPKPHKPQSESISGWASLVKSNAVADPKTFRMENLLADAAPADKAISIAQADLIVDPGASPVSREFFHDLTTESTGLLTNTATGGWRKDLSLFTESWSAQPAAGLPLFRVAPDRDLSYSKPSPTSYRPDGSLFYPWASYSGTQGQLALYQLGASGSWANMQDWATLYKTRIQGSDASALSVESFSVPLYWSDANSCHDYLHKVRTVPLLARVQWLFSYWAVPSTGGSQNLYEPRLLMTPVVTIWNPYNVTLVPPKPLYYVTREPLPNAFRFTVNGVANTKYAGLTRGPDFANKMIFLEDANHHLFYRIPDVGGSLKPGECRVFSPASSNRRRAWEQLNMEKGFRPGGGFFFNLKKDDGSIYSQVPASAIIKADAKFDTNINEGNPDGSIGGRVGIYLDMCYPTGGAADISGGGGWGDVKLAYRLRLPNTMVNGIYGELTGLATATAAQASGTPVPFMTTIFGARSASNTHLASKGFVQSSPLNCYSEIVAIHPVNATFDYSFKELGGAGDSWWPGSDSAGSGFIITGFQSADGLKRCVIDELPVRPIQSLAELQHWDLRYDFPLPPFSFNIIGNSDATPLIPADKATYLPDNSQVVSHSPVQYDDSFCSNHLLFDDWFVSSIAPMPAGFGRPSGVESLGKTYTDFVSGKAPLPNRAYHAIAEDIAAARTSAGADKLFNDHANQVESWRSIASRIEVEGMFNVNSTSVAAWRALLGHARGQKIPYFTPDGVALSGSRDHAFSRFSIAGDTESRTRGTSGDYSDCAEFAGYRILSDAVLDRLAVEVVNQVRARGPFLSLAEFVNRQLSSGQLALGGAIQSALNAVQKDPALNPYAQIEKRSKLADANPPLANLTGYQFPEAAVGYNTYGIPGWTRQADILTPIAPILSARDDTFIIRCYGDAKDAAGKITARATCEATVRRTRAFLDPADPADTTTPKLSDMNQMFGRRYQIISFRWLNDAEI